MIDPETVAGILVNLDTYLGQLRQLATVPHVDADLLYDTLQNNLGDFDRFKTAVLRFIRLQEP